MAHVHARTRICAKSVISYAYTQWLGLFFFTISFLSLLCPDRSTHAYSFFLLYSFSFILAVMQVPLANTKVHNRLLELINDTIHFCVTITAVIPFSNPLFVHTPICVDYRLQRTIQLLSFELENGASERACYRHHHASMGYE